MIASPECLTITFFREFFFLLLLFFRFFFFGNDFLIVVIFDDFVINFVSVFDSVIRCRDLSRSNGAPVNAYVKVSF